MDTINKERLATHNGTAKRKADYVEKKLGCDINDRINKLKDTIEIKLNDAEQVAKNFIILQKRAEDVKKYISNKHICKRENYKIGSCAACTIKEFLTIYYEG